jgi:hypothetical protein
VREGSNPSSPATYLNLASSRSVAETIGDRIPRRLGSTPLADAF